MKTAAQAIGSSEFHFLNGACYGLGRYRLFKYLDP